MVVIKGIEEKSGTGSNGGAWDMPPLRATQKPKRGGGKDREVLSVRGIPLPPRGSWDTEKEEMTGLPYRDDSEDEDMNAMLNEAWTGGVTPYGNIQDGAPELGETVLREDLRSGGHRFQLFWFLKIPQPW